MDEAQQSQVPGITRVEDASGQVTYHYWADASWDGFDSLIAYLRKHWSASVVQANHEVYSRTSRVRLGGEDVEVRFDGYGITMKAEGPTPSPALERIFEDLTHRLR